jgi:hypothetical protein
LFEIMNRFTLSSGLQYQGQDVKTSKQYDTYEDYKDDPNNLDPAEIPKMQQLVESAPIEKHFSDRQSLIYAMFQLKFPGYGLSSFGEKKQSDGSTLDLESVEIPQSDKQRFFLFRGDANGYTLIDDFVSSDAGISNVTVAGNQIVYSDRKGAPILRRVLQSTN